MALALGFNVLLTLLVLSGINAVHVISHLQSNNEDILGEFLGRAPNGTAVGRPTVQSVG
jgi:hypothetical protein